MKLTCRFDYFRSVCNALSSSRSGKMRLYIDASYTGAHHMHNAHLIASTVLSNLCTTQTQVHRTRTRISKPAHAHTHTHTHAHTHTHTRVRVRTLTRTRLKPTICKPGNSGSSGGSGVAVDQVEASKGASEPCCFCRCCGMLPWCVYVCMCAHM